MRSPGFTLDLRRSCERVAGLARSVAIDDAALTACAADLPAARGAPVQDDEVPGDARHDRAAFVLCLDAVNFGSGWFPTLRKRPGVSGFHTISHGLRARFESNGAWDAEELAAIDCDELGLVFGQDPEHELIGLYAVALREVGRRIANDFDGDWLGPVEAAGSSAVALAEIAGAWPAWRDVSSYAGEAVPFFKRAQILAADLHRAGVAELEDLDDLTMFADNLVPHVLRLDGVLQFAPPLVRRIEAGELLAHGSPEEVEIRACALHAVERIVELRPDLAAWHVDELLWTRGGEPRYKSQPRHRARCTAY